MRREKGAAVARALRAAALAGLFGAAFPGESPAAQPPRGRLVVLNKLEVIGRITAGREPDGLAGAFAPAAR